MQWISRYPEGGGLQSDLEALERMTADPSQAAETLVGLCPVVFRSHWAALLLDLAGADPQLVPFDDPGPRSERTLVDRLAPFDRTHRTDLEHGWLPGWGDSTVVVTPLTRDRAIVIGRLGGPAFMDSEIARLHHLAALVK